MWVSMHAWIKCRRSGICDNPTTIMTSRDSSDFFDIWRISCQILPHTCHLYWHVSKIGSHSYGPHSSTSVLSLSKHSLARCQYWSLLMQVTQSLFGLYVTAPHLESGPCTDKAQTGNPAFQQASYQRKFSSVQQNYHTHEHEMIAILEALIKWEDKLLGQKIVIVTNHKSLEYFKTQPHLSSRQTRWWNTFPALILPSNMWMVQPIE